MRSTSNQTRLIAGAMSGTSADGVDVAIVRIAGTGHDMEPALLLHHQRPYPEALRHMIFAARSGGSMNLRDLADLGQQVSLNHAAAVNEALVMAKLDAGELACVAVHGQTLFHDPPLTIQWLDPALLAEEVGCPVVSDFRRADCAAGGQGAPLVPFADYILFRHETKNRVMANIGGIANITFVPAGCAIAKLIAFDTGPGNCISDWLMRRDQGPGFDADGQRATRGSAISPIVERFLSNEYFERQPPKSTDIPSMIELFRASLDAGPSAPSLDDLLATACRITAEAMLTAMQRFLPTQVDELVLSGGGVHNRAILRHLEEGGRGSRRAALANVRILTSDDLGIPSEAKEAIAFALLGAATLDRVPANIPSATGAQRPVVLGAITPKP